MNLAEIINKLDQPLRPAVVCYLLKDDQILLGLRKRVSFGLGENLISGIGGKIELDNDLYEKGEVSLQETADEALIRELQEEIDITPTKFTNIGRVRFIFPAKPKWNQDIVVYTCTEWQGTPSESEEIAPTWYQISDLESLFPRMWHDNRFWVPEIARGRTIDAIIVYAEDNATVARMQIDFEPDEAA